MPCISTRKEYVSVTEASSGPIGWFHGSCELPGPELRLQKNLFLTFQRKTTIKAQNWEKTLHHWRVSPPSPCPLIGLPSPPPPEHILQTQTLHLRTGRPFRSQQQDRSVDSPPAAMLWKGSGPSPAPSRYILLPFLCPSAQLRKTSSVVPAHPQPADHVSRGPG